jgi:pseudouridine synthase
MILNKPPGFVCSTLSSKRHRSIYSLLPGGGSPTLKYAGRLDADSEGLVLLTDDGELIFRLTHPRYKLRKIYLVKTSRIPDRKSMQRLESGIELSDGMTRPCRARLEAQGGGGAVVRVELFEGRNRQLRRMFDAVGFRVTGLKRIGIGSLRLGSLMQGKTRKLTGIEIERLKKSVGLPGSR